MGKSVSTWWEWKKKNETLIALMLDKHQAQLMQENGHMSLLWAKSLLHILTDSCLSWDAWLRAALLMKTCRQLVVRVVDIWELLCLRLIKFCLCFNLLVAVGVAIVQSSLTELHASSFHRLSEKCSKVWVICIDILHPVCRASHMSPVSRSLYQTRGKEKTN